MLFTCTMCRGAPVATALARTSCIASIVIERTWVWMVLSGMTALLIPGPDPAGDPNHETRAHHVFTEDVLVRSLAPHMHYRGKDMR